MKAICDMFIASKCFSSTPVENFDKSPTSLVSDSTLPLVSQTLREASTPEHQPGCTTRNGWTVISMASWAIRRLQDRLLGPSRTGISSSINEIWLLRFVIKSQKVNRQK